MSREQEDRGLGTADLVAATQSPQPEQRATHQDERDLQQQQPQRDPASGQLAALFDADVAQDFRSRWSEVQIGFVDDPKRAVQQADELVAQVMKSLAESFARQRSNIEADVGGADQASTENLRVALRSYRSFFERLLSL
jgi:hypothetical protein